MERDGSIPCSKEPTTFLILDFRRVLIIVNFL